MLEEVSFRVGRFTREDLRPFAITIKNVVYSCRRLRGPDIGELAKLAAATSSTGLNVSIGLTPP
jgi:hypothetical protein